MDLNEIISNLIDYSIVTKYDLSEVLIVHFGHFSAKKWKIGNFPDLVFNFFEKSYRFCFRIFCDIVFDRFQIRYRCC